MSLLELGKKPLAPVLSDVAEEMGSDEDKTPHSPNTEAERKDSVGGLQHSESPVISQNPETGDALETQKTPTSPEENVFEINSPVFSGRKKRKSLVSLILYLYSNISSCKLCRLLVLVVHILN